MEDIVDTPSTPINTLISTDVTFFEQSLFMSSTAEPSLHLKCYLLFHTFLQTIYLMLKCLQVPLKFVQIRTIYHSFASTIVVQPSGDKSLLAHQRSNRSTRNLYLIYNFIHYHCLSSPNYPFVTTLPFVFVPKKHVELFCIQYGNNGSSNECPASKWNLRIVSLPPSKMAVDSCWMNDV